MKRLTVPEWAAQIGVERTQAFRLVKAGRVPGAEQIGRQWTVPDGTPKPPPLTTGAAAHKPKT